MNAISSLSGERAVCRAVRAIAPLALVAGLFAGGLLSGCTGSPDEQAPPAEIKTVEAYGVTLDPAATPQQVAYVLLRSIADDYAAAKAKDAKAQRAAQLLTYSLCAPKTMEERLVQTLNLINPSVNKTSLGSERDERLYKMVHFWGPVVGHYVPTFANADLQTVLHDSWSTIDADGKQARVYYPVSHDPTSEPSKAETATICIELAHEAAQAGGPEYWRVTTVAFLGRKVSPPSQPMVVQANGLTLDENASPEQVAAVMLQSLAQMIQAGKSESKDLQVSTLYRIYCLSYPAQVRSRMSADEKLTSADAVSLAVKLWAAQVSPSLLAIQTGVAPDKMQATGNTSGLAEATYPLGTGSTITVQLAQQTALNKAYWRVVGVKAQTANGPTSAAGQ